MARNLTRYGYKPNRVHNLVVEDIQHRLRQGMTSKTRPARTPEQQRAAITPMKASERDRAYERQSFKATPRQGRRDRHKLNRSAARSAA